jgi:hypothetical protein
VTAYKVIEVDAETRKWDWPKGSGQFNVDYTLTVDQHDGPVTLTQKPETAPPVPGQVVEGTLEPAKVAGYPPKLKKAQQFVGGGGGLRARDPKETAAIVRQHSQHMCLLYLQAKAQQGAITQFPAMEEIRKVIDWFDADVAQAKGKAA